LNESIDANTYVIGLFGIGSDGHTAGILPNSPAVTAAAEVAFYQASDYPRITISPVFFSKIHTAIVYAMGSAKLQALENLKQDLPAVLEPAQLLKQIPDTWIYTDQMGENA
jgi:6-phosphogluconolactonase/glucosamine-6-phosphate isomerase/deaminase